MQDVKEAAIVGAKIVGFLVVAAGPAWVALPALIDYPIWIFLGGFAASMLWGIFCGVIAAYRIFEWDSTSSLNPRRHRIERNRNNTTGETQ